jgi:hypothetical protein
VKKLENECVGCTSLGLHCLGDACSKRNILHYYCDKCGEEFEPEALYVTEDDEDLCEECILENFPTVKECER